VLLDLWSSWCEPCISELAGFEQISQAHPEVSVLLVATRSELSQVRKIVEEQGIHRSEIFVDDSDSSAFGLSGVPQTYVIDWELTHPHRPLWKRARCKVVRGSRFGLTQERSA
jgi:thiol-disulfide isomerase/thioredoxin